MSARTGDDFAVGDSVRSTRGIGEKVPAGTPGKVVRIGDVPLSPFDYRVRFAGYPYCKTIGEKDWPVMASEIERDV